MYPNQKTFKNSLTIWFMKGCILTIFAFIVKTYVLRMLIIVIIVTDVSKSLIITASSLTIALDTKITNGLSYFYYRSLCT